MYAMKDAAGTTLYSDSAWFWMYSNQERRRNNIMKGLLKVVQKIDQFRRAKPIYNSI